MGQVLSISNTHIRAVEGAEMPTLKVSGTVGVDFSGSDLADAVVRYAGDFGEAKLLLDSFGGFASDAFAFYDTVRAEGVRLHVDGRGTVASAATIIMAAAGRKRSRLYPHAEYLIHGATGGDAESVERANKKMEAIYVELSGMTSAEVRKIMKADAPMSAQEAKRMGFVGSVIELMKLAAHADNTKTMADEKKVKRVFAVDRKDAAAAAFTGEIEILVDAADAALKTELDSAVSDLKAERAKSADLEASLKTKAEDIAKAVKEAEDKLKAEHAAALEAGGKINEGLKAEVEKLTAELKKQPAAPAVKAAGANGVVDTPIAADLHKKLTAEERAAAFDKQLAEVRAKATAA